MTSARPTAALIWLLFAAGGLMALPAESQSALRLAVGDVLRPGAIAWKTARRQCEHLLARAVPANESTPDLEQLTAERDQAERKSRLLEVQLARLQEQLAAQTPALPAMARRSDIARLAVPTLIPAAVLNQSSSSQFRHNRWLDQGNRTGLAEEAPILRSERPLIDVGRDAGLTSEDRLLSGRSVIGKVQHVGRWTSTFLMITDAEFRGRAQLVRVAAQGPVFGAKGILRGTGKGSCKLDGVPATEAVEVGDAVYTTDRDGAAATPLFYGTVSSATLDERGKNWQITVKPAEQPADLTHVEVLRTALNTRRVLAN